MRSAIRSGEALRRHLDDKATALPVDYPLFIPQNLLKNIQNLGPDSALWKQFIPSTIEENSHIQHGGLMDAIGDEAKARGNGIIHRYQNRILFTPTTHCPVQCRYCFRKNELHSRADFLNGKVAALSQYLALHSEVDEVILTGGDPLVLDNEKIEKLLYAINKSSPSVRSVRFHTRFPTILPQRIDNDFCQMLSRVHEKTQLDLVIIIHTNHLEEFTNEVELAVRTLVRLLPGRIFSQSVLLKGINDNVSALYDLYEKLWQLKVIPHYLHHPDLVYGAMHFYLDQKTGHELFQALRQRLSGHKLPKYVVDSPQASGKVQV